MPYYSELGIYTPSSSYTSPLIKGPYSSHSSIMASNILPPSSKFFNRSNFRGYKPHLMTISETSNISPLRRVSSPKIYHTSPKVRVPRPIKINTADIDVSVNRFKKYSPPSTKPQNSNSESRTSPQSPQKESTPPSEPKEAKPNTTIRRDRATIRLQTIHKDALEKEIGQIRSWRDNFKPDELVTEAKRQKKTPGEILKEKFLIRSKSKDNVPQSEPPKLTKKLSVKRNPSFKDICKEITSDQAIEDLNPGQPVAIRRRQSRQISHDDILRELHRSSSTLSVEEVQILDALLQAENEVGLHDVPPMVEDQPKSVRRKKTAKKKSSEKLSLEDNKTEKQTTNDTKVATADDTNKDSTNTSVHRRSILKKSSSELSIPDSSATAHTRLRKDSSLKNMVKDISQVEIEMISTKPRPVITGFVGDIEETAKNNLKAIVEDLNIQESPKQEKKEKKFRFNVTVQEFPIKKSITAPKHELKNDNYGILQFPCSEKCAVTFILKKKEAIQVGVAAGDGKVFKKIEEPADNDTKKKLLKSLSEVQVRSVEQNKLQKSESNDSVTNNYTVTVNKAKSDEAITVNGEKSREGSHKLKIVSIQKGVDKVGENQAVQKDNANVYASIDSSNVKENIPKVETKVNEKDLKSETDQTETLLKSTKKELKSDMFLCKSNINKKDSMPAWADRFRKEQARSVEDKTEKKEVPKKSISLDETVIDQKPIVANKLTENKEEPVAAPVVFEERESNKKPNNVLLGDSNRNSVKSKLNDLKDEQTKAEDISEIEFVPKYSAGASLDEDNKDSSLKTTLNNLGDQETKNKDISKIELLPTTVADASVKDSNKDSSPETELSNLKGEQTKKVDILGTEIIPNSLADASVDDSNKDSSLKTKLKDLQDDQTNNADVSKIEPLPKSSAKIRKEEKPVKDENDNQIDFPRSLVEDKSEPSKVDKPKLKLKDPKAILGEIQEIQKEQEPSAKVPETPEEREIRMISKRSLVQKANKSDPDLVIFEPPTPPPPEPVKSPSPEPAWVPLQTNRLSQWMHPWKKPEQQAASEVELYAKPKYIRARHIPRRWQQPVVNDSESSTTSDDDSSSEESEEESEEESGKQIGADNKIGASTSSDDSGFDSGRAKNDECDVNCHKKCEHLVPNLCGVNQKLVVEAIEKVRKGSVDSRDSPGNTLTPALNPAFALDFNDVPEEVSQSSTYQGFQRSGRITPPATTIPRFRKYCVDDFNFLKVLGKGSFGKVLLAELKGTEYYYAIKCLKKDVVLEDDDVECTLIERKVLALGTKHPYLCHLLCTFQTESHLFFVMEYLNGGDLMFHIQVERRFSEPRARFYGAEIVSGLKFLHNKGIVYRDLKLDNILLDFDGHVRIADFGMCKLQIFLDRMADTFCGTPDYMAPEIIKGQHYNQSVDWWSFGVLLYEMLLGQSPYSGCDEDELFWSICNEKPVIPRFLSAEASSVLNQFLDKDGNKRLGNRFSPHGDIQDHTFFKPIDWTALENRQLEPPFKPNLQHPLDTKYFDKTFTTERAKLTPIETAILQSMDQTQFQGFSYTNPNATDK